MSKQGRGREFSVGVTLMLALALVAGLILMLGRESRTFTSRRTFFTKVANSIGLKTGSPVVMGGVQIGAVSAVKLSENPEDQGITLELSVDKGYSGRIRQGSIASVGFITLLSGEKYVEISSGEPSAPVLPDGAQIPVDTSATLLETGQNVAEDLGAAARQLRDILASINRGEGLVGQLVKADRPYFGEQAIVKFEGVLERADRTIQGLEKGQGTLGRLLKDEEFSRQTLGSVESAAKRLDRVLASIENREGAIGDLLANNGSSQELIANLRAASGSLKAASAKLESTTGVLGRVLNDEEYSEGVARDLRAAVTQLNTILGKINRGEGSLGALINDPAVYRGLNDIVAGINKSRLAKMALRHYGRKGARMRTAEETETPPPEAPPPVPPPSGEPPAPDEVKPPAPGEVKPPAPGEVKPSAPEEGTDPAPPPAEAGIGAEGPAPH